MPTANANSYTDGYADSNANADANTDSDSDADADANTDADSDSNPNSKHTADIYTGRRDLASAGNYYGSGGDSRFGQ